MFAYIILDIRQNFCYEEYTNGICRSPKSSNMTRKECCCMKGSVAWGADPCERCPDQRSGELYNLILYFNF